VSLHLYDYEGGLEQLDARMQRCEYPTADRGRERRSTMPDVLAVGSIAAGEMRADGFGGCRVRRKRRIKEIRG
jgi:hypothetical protein